MKWLLTYLSSSIGKKQVMGASGCMLVLFVLGHMVGNLQLLNPDPAAAQASYNAYSALLTKSKLFLYAVEGGLAIIFIIHIYLAILLKLQNRAARGSADYVVSARKGRKAFPTFIMIWTGLSIIAFIVWHILTVRNGLHYYYINPEVADGKVVRDMWLTTVEVLGNPLFALFYTSLMLLLGFHLWHAISSAVQTMGINHHKWTPIIEKLSIAYCVVVASGFAATAVGSYAVVNFMPEAKEIFEQAKDPKYQQNLKKLSQMDVDFQKRIAKIAYESPENLDMLIERGNMLPFKRDRKGDKRMHKERKRFEQPQQETQTQPQNVIPDEKVSPEEGGEQ